MSDVVMVLGMHRAGTSAVAGVLTKLGGRPPNTLLDADEGNAKGYFESKVLTAFNDELLASAGSYWHDWRRLSPGWYASPTATAFSKRAKELFSAEFDHQPIAVLKDPRICRFAPFWLDVFKAMDVGVRVVIPIRSPLEVAQSLKHRHRLSLRKGLLLWLRHCLDAERDTRDLPRAIFTWLDFQADWRRVAEQITRETALSWPALSDRSVAEIEAFLDAREMHFNVADTRLALQSDVQEWTLTAYRSLLSLVAEPDDRAALEALDEVRRQFDSACEVFGPVLSEQELSLEGDAALIASLRDERATAVVALDAHKAASDQQAESFQAALIQAAAERDASVADLVLARDAAQARSEHLEHLLGEAQQEVARWSTDHAALAEEQGARIQRLSDELARSNADAGGQAQVLADAQRHISQLKEELAHARDEAARGGEDLTEAQRRIQQLGDEVQLVRDEAARDGESLAAAQRRVQELAEEVERARDEAARGGEDLTEAQRRIQQLSDEVKLARDEAARDGESLAAAQRRVQELIEEVERARDEAARGGEDLTEAQRRIQQLGDEVKLARDEAARDGDSLAAAQRRVHELTEEVEQARNESARHGEDLTEAQRRIQQLGDEVKLARDEAARDGESLAAAQRRVQELAEEVERARGEAARLSEELILRNEAIRVTEQAAAQAKAAEVAALAEARARDHAAVAELAAISYSLEQETCRSAGLVQQIEAASAAVSELERRLGLEAAAREQATANAVAAQSEVRRLNLDLAEVRDGRSAAERDLLSAKVIADAAIARLEQGARRPLGRRVLLGPYPVMLRMWKLSRSGLFDSRWYRGRNAYLMAPGELAIGHYTRVGFALGCEPNPVFDSLWYLSRYDDVTQSGFNPVLHYALAGWREGRDPGPGFSTRFYLEQNPDVAASGANPLAHYLRHGRREGRLPRRLAMLA